jgi:hypothetical protein
MYIFNVFCLYLLNRHHHNSLLIINIRLLIGMIRHPFLGWFGMVITNRVAIHVMSCRRLVVLLVWEVLIVDRLRCIDIIDWIVRLVINGSSIVELIVGRVV